MKSAQYDEEWLEGPGSHRFYTRTYSPSGPPKAVIIFLHGFADHSGRYAAAHAQWSQHGYLLFAYDQRGFGRTALDAEHSSSDALFGKTSHRQTVEDLEFWIRFVARRWPDAPLFLSGYSTEIALSLACVHSGSPTQHTTLAMLSGIIAISPLFELAEKKPRYIRWGASCMAVLLPDLPFPAGIPENLFSRDPNECHALATDTLRRTYGRLRGLVDMIDMGEMVLEAASLWPSDQLPVLQIWGSADKVNSVAAGVQFHDRLPIHDKTLRMHEGAYHDLLHEIDGVPERVTQEMVAWVGAHLLPCWTIDHK